MAGTVMTAALQRSNVGFLMATAQQMRAYTGPAILSYGFRPFFLAGAVWSALAVALWLPMLAGQLVLPTLLAPIEWHAHELIYGYAPAVVAGFLLTAVPNWTGRQPLTGTPLLGLFLVWAAGRVGVAVSAWTGPLVAGLLDLSFLTVLAAFVARELLAADNARNLKVVAVIGLLIAGNLVFHVEAAAGYAQGYGIRIGIAAIILLIMLIGGRIIPAFTRNWLARRPPGRLPEMFSRFDAASMIASAAALVLWVLLPTHPLTALLAVVAGVFNIARLARWAGERTLAEPLVTILHVAYAFVPAGFLLLALAIAAPGVVVATGALHAWTAGAIGLMTLAVMTRASLGHTGRPLTATRGIQAIYAAVLIAALARLLAAFDLAREPMLHLSATLWVAGFVGFAVVYTPLMVRVRG